MIKVSLPTPPSQDPLFTADQVIDEIDAMMSESEVEGESSSGSSELDTPTSDPGFGGGSGGGGDDRLHFKERPLMRPGELGGVGAMSPSSYKEMLGESGTVLSPFG